MTVFLSVHNQDIERCLQALEELEAVPVTSQILQRNAEVIATLKKVRLQAGSIISLFFHYALLNIHFFFFFGGCSRSGDIKPALQ